MKHYIYVFIACVTLGSCSTQAAENRLEKKNYTLTENFIQKTEIVRNIVGLAFWGKILVSVGKPLCTEILLPLAGIACTEGVKMCVSAGLPMTCTAGVIVGVPLYYTFQHIREGIKILKK